MIEVFPVALDLEFSDRLPPQYRERGGERKRCPRDRVWYADWHLARRGPHLHHAQDVFAPSGSLVLAPEGGVIVASSADTGPTEKGGHYLRLRSGRRVYYLAHLLDRPEVRAGDQVRAGELIGRVGRTGNAMATCPHLHIGARERGRAVNLYPELRAVDPTLARATEARA